MSLFDMCCPKKPKKSLDYIIKWIEDADKTFSNINASIAGINTAISAIHGDIKDLEDWKSVVESNISELVTEAIEDYDWSNLPAEALQAKADKVENAVVGHLASLDANGNLVDSGSGIDEAIEEGNTDLATCNAVYIALQGKTDKVSSATADNLASLDAGGNLQDSGKKPADFAEADHEHDYISNFNGYANCGASISVGENEQGAGGISLIVKGDGQGTDSKTAEIDYFGIDNLNRALQDPEAPTQGSDKLSTSGHIYTAISKKSDKEFCDKIYSRLMELEKNSSVEYGVTATYVYREAGANRPRLKIDGTDIIYLYDSDGGKIMGLYNVPYLYGLVFVGDVLVIKDLTTGTSIGTATVEDLSTGPNRIALSGLSLPDTSSYEGKNIEIAITHGNY